MTAHSKQIVEALEAISKQPVQHFAPKDNREPGAYWPAYQPDDLPQDYWTDNVLEIV